MIARVKSGWKVLFGLLSAFPLLWVTALPAAAHDSLLSSDPPDKATVARTPSVVVLTLDEPPLALGAQVVVTGPSGQVQTGNAQIVDNTLRQDLQPGAPAGVYQVVWRVSSDDGHPVTGSLSFTSQAASAGEPSSAGSQPPADTTQAVKHHHSHSGGPIPWLIAGVIALGAIGYSLLWQPLRLRRRDRSSA
jgi:methionine-rich copper-binding protein CopC